MTAEVRPPDDLQRRIWSKRGGMRRTSTSVMGKSLDQARYYRERDRYGALGGNGTGRAPWQKALRTSTRKTWMASSAHSEGCDAADLSVVARLVMYFLDQTRTRRWRVWRYLTARAVGTNGGRRVAIAPRVRFCRESIGTGASIAGEKSMDVKIRTNSTLLQPSIEVRVRVQSTHNPWF